MILLIDNYDSFTFNLYQQLGELGAEVHVVRNDKITVPQALALEPVGVVLSPGPGRPSGAGITPSLLEALPDEVPLLGVCLGHQALVESMGGALEVDPTPVHGKSSRVHHDGSELFDDLPNPFTAGRYHSLRASRDELPPGLLLSAWTEDGHVMAVRHASLPRWGVQFHPESILTPQGERLCGRFLSRAGVAVVRR